MPPKFSFCTTVRNRRRQFELTFGSNLQVLAATSDVEWVILDFGSSQNEVELYWNAGQPSLIRWVRVNADFWHASKAKNAAVAHSSGSIIFNLDADQHIGNAIMAASNCSETTLVHNWSGIFRTGTCGRIACSRQVFESLGGYDEEFLPCGYDDLDLLERAKAMGNSVEFINCGHHVAIANTEEEAIADCKSEGVTWDEMEKSNRIRSKWNIGHGILVANTQNRILPAATVDTRMI